MTVRGPEYQRTQRITEALRRFGWLHVWFRPARVRDKAGNETWRTAFSGDAGFPDIIAVHAERGLLLFAEVKSNKGQLSPEQKRWAVALTATQHRFTMASLHYLVVDSDESEAELLALISGGRTSAT